MIELLSIPVGLGQEQLQLLDRRVLCLDTGFRPDEPGQRLAAVTGEQEALQIVAEAAALGNVLVQARAAGDRDGEGASR